MANLKSKSSVPAESKSKKSTKVNQKNVNWHVAATCAIQIDLRDYSHMLEFLTEYPLGKKGSYRIDMLLIKKLSEQEIPKNITKIFRTLNLFEIKGLGSSMNTDCYFKTIGYAGLLIEQSGNTGEFTNTDISLSFLCMHYPRDLIKFLTEKRHLIVEKSAPGVYHIINDIFDAQIIVTYDLSPYDSLYLRCLTDHLTDKELTDMLTADYSDHKEMDIYVNYLEQITTANYKKEGDNEIMVCEGLFRLFGTSSEEIRTRAREEAKAETKAEAAAFYQPKIDALSSANSELSSAIKALTSRVDYLQNLLIKNNISFNTES